MKKHCLFSLFLAFALLLCACGGTETTTEAGTVPASKETSAAAAESSSETAAETAETAGDTVSMYDLSKAMCAADPSLPEMSRISSSDAAELFSYFSKMDYGKVEDYFLSYAAKGTAEEIGVILLKDEKDVQECITSLEAHLKDRVDLYKTYAPEQVKRAENTAILSKGRYVAFIMCDEQKAVTEAFHQFIEGK